MLISVVLDVIYFVSLCACVINVHTPSFVMIQKKKVSMFMLWSVGILNPPSRFGEDSPNPTLHVVNLDLSNFLDM